MKHNNGMQKTNTTTLVGMPGVGKTTVGQVLADQLKVDFYDSDQAVEEAAGMSVAEIFDAYDEEQFRILEKDALRQLAAEPGAKVIATGGGAFADVETRQALLESGAVVWLNNASVDDLAARVVKSGRPLLADRPDLIEHLKEISRVRRKHYAKAHFAVTEAGDVSDTVKEIMGFLGRKP